MAPRNDRIPEEAAQAIWRRAAQLQAEAERRMEEKLHRIAPPPGTDLVSDDGLDPNHVRIAGEEAGISPEFVQIALAEAAGVGISTPVRPASLTVRGPLL